MKVRAAIVGPVLVAAACARVGPPARPTEAVAPSGSSAGSVVVAAGTLDLPAANAFGEPGFHEALVARTPARVGGAGTLTLSLRDGSRPGQTCSMDHPLSGCATVDWSDDPSRPNTPESGVFTNAISLELENGTHTFYLTPGGGFANHPNPYQPG